MKHLTEAELTNPAVLPNPFIKKLVDLNSDIYAESLEQLKDHPDAGFEYNSAYQHIMAAISSLFKVKNILAGE